MGKAGDVTNSVIARLEWKPAFRPAELHPIAIMKFSSSPNPNFAIARGALLGAGQLRIESSKAMAGQSPAGEQQKANRHPVAVWEKPPKVFRPSSI